jgi:hypothetical protein
VSPIDTGAEQLVVSRDVVRHGEQQAKADICGGVGDDRRMLVTDAGGRLGETMRSWVMSSTTPP